MAASDLREKERVIRSLGQQVRDQAAVIADLRAKLLVAEEGVAHNGAGKVLWSVGEVCEALSLGRTFVLELAYSGKIPSFTVGRRRVFPVDGVRAWAATYPWYHSLA